MSATYPRMETRSLDSIASHPDGCRSSDADGAYGLDRTYELLGLLRPPFVLNARTGNLIDGDRMLDVLRRRGVKEAPVWVVDVPEELEDAAHLALQNHVGDWVWQPVSEHLKALNERGVPMCVTGFHASDYGPLTKADWKPAEKGPLDGGDAKQEGFGF